MFPVGASPMVGLPNSSDRYGFGVGVGAGVGRGVGVGVGRGIGVGAGRGVGADAGGGWMGIGWKSASDTASTIRTTVIGNCRA